MIPHRILALLSLTFTRRAGHRCPMRCLRHVAFTVLAAFASGCGESAPTGPAAEIVRPALIHTVEPGSAVAKLRFPGRIRAERRAELSFDVPGFVSEFEAKEGGAVAMGAVVARLDDSVFSARVSAARAEFDHATVELDRYRRLWETEQAVARSEVDERRSRLEVARTNLAAAEQALADTVIRAPFAGVITRRRIEAFTNVQAKQAIADLQDLEKLEVVINVPARVVRTAAAQQSAEAVFEGQDSRPLALELKSFASEADPQTQTYEIVLRLRSLPGGMNVLPGMSVTVMPFAAMQAPDDATVSIPLTAIASDARDGSFVWVVGEDGRVARRAVVTGDVHGGSITISSGLRANERIVAAGVSALREGMQVRALAAD